MQHKTVLAARAIAETTRTARCKREPNRNTATIANAITPHLGASLRKYPVLGEVEEKFATIHILHNKAQKIRGLEAVRQLRQERVIR